MLVHMTARTTISMPDDLWEQVVRQQNESGASTSEIVRRALVAFFPEKPANGRKPVRKTAVTKTPAKKAPPAKATKAAPKPVTKRVRKQVVKA